MDSQKNIYNEFYKQTKTYNRIARFYDIFDLPFEQFRYKPLRWVLFSGLSGTLLDAGVGTGRNFIFYPDGAKIIGIDLSTAMLDRARLRKDKFGTAVDLRAMNVLALDFADDSFDGIVSTFLFSCSTQNTNNLPLKSFAGYAAPTAPSAF